jgi:hypothetical protein
MSEKIKISEEELKLFQELQTKVQEKLLQFGKLYIEKLQVEQTIKNITGHEGVLVAELEDLQKQETALVENMLKKYGEGSLDIKSGMFIRDNKIIETTSNQK